LERVLERLTSLQLCHTRTQASNKLCSTTSELVAFMFKLRKYAISGSFTRTYTRLGTVIHFPPQLLTIRGGAYLLNGVFEGGQLDVTVVKELLQLS